jgi:hypothetical protein
MRFPVRQSLPRQTVILALLFIMAGFSGCRSDRVAVDKKDLDSPQYEYRKDELALLQMVADDIQELERKKQYGTIYDDYASPAFQKGVGRRQFMIMANCVESFLGDLEEYDRNDIGFNRQFTKGQPKSDKNYVDVLNRKVQRALGSIEEQLVFAPSGLGFKLNGLYWIAKDKAFIQCMRQSGQLDAETAPKPEVLPEAATTPAVSSQTATESNKTTPSETPSASTEETRQPASGQATPSTETGNQPPTPVGGLNSLETKSVQTMKPAEVRKEQIKARPAGAGAVVDQRPTPKKTKEQIQAEEQAAKRRIEPSEPTEMVPLPTTGGSDD